MKTDSDQNLYSFETKLLSEEESMSKTFNVAMVGLGFGAEFIPIYQNHPNANVLAICRRNEDELNKCGEQFGIDRRYTTYDEVLADSDVDYVHINSPNSRSRVDVVEGARRRQACDVHRADGDDD